MHKASRLFPLSFIKKEIELSLGLFNSGCVMLEPHRGGMKMGIIMISSSSSSTPPFVHPPLFFFSLHLGYYRLFPSTPPPLKGKKNSQRISILLSGNISEAHAASTLHSSHCSSPDAWCFFGSLSAAASGLVSPRHNNNKQRLVPDN